MKLTNQRLERPIRARSASLTVSMLELKNKEKEKKEKCNSFVNSHHAHGGLFIGLSVLSNDNTTWPVIMERARSLRGPIKLEAVTNMVCYACDSIKARSESSDAERVHTLASDILSSSIKSSYLAGDGMTKVTLRLVWSFQPSHPNITQRKYF